MIIGIICAMDPEAESLVAKLKNAQDIVLGKAHFYTGSLEDHDVVIARSGIGKVSAAYVTAILITKFNVLKFDWYHTFLPWYKWMNVFMTIIFAQIDPITHEFTFFLLLQI